MFIPPKHPADQDSAATHNGMATAMDVIGCLPWEIQIAFDQSGVLEDGRDLDWVLDQRVIKALLKAQEAHGGKMRREDHETHRLIHEIWMAQRIYNDAHLNAWLRENNYDPMLGVIAVIVHDSVENRRKLAEDAGNPFIIETVLSDVRELMPDAESRRALFSCLRYMTDQPGLEKTVRYETQRAKSFDIVEGHLCINLLEQTARKLDKMSHVIFDAASSKKGRMPPQNALKSWMQAALKIFPLEFPAATREDKREYLEAMGVLAADTRMTSAALDLALHAAFNGNPELQYAYCRVTAEMTEPANDRVDMSPVWRMGRFREAPIL